MTDEDSEGLFGFQRDDLNLAFGVLFGAFVILSVIQTFDVEGAIAGWNQQPTGDEVVGEVAQVLFSTWAVPFEVLSVLLLVALVGSVAVAMRRDSSTEGT